MMLDKERRIDSEQLLGLALQVAREAGKEIADIYLQDFVVEQKADGTPLTLADRRSSEIITERLSETGLPIVNEESKENYYEARRGQEYLWIVDPLDGTKEFIKKNGEFTVNIALIHNNRPVIGVIYAPIKDCTYYALNGMGAYKIEKAAETKLPLESVFSGNDSRITVVGSKSHSNRALSDCLTLLKERFNEVAFISAGSSLKFGLVAEGKAQIYPRTTPTMEWDTAAGQIIVEESNGEVVDRKSGRPLSYNKEDLENPWFVAYRKEIVSCIKELL